MERKGVICVQRSRRLTDSLTKICQLFTHARERTLVISAYLGAETLHSLLCACPATVHRAVFANWTHENIASGASDWKAWDVARNHGVPMYDCPNLHAKVYVADGRAIVGSANATARGLQSGVPSNLELLIEVDADTREVQDLINVVQAVSEVASPFGSDVLINNEGDDSSNEVPNLPVWAPSSDPEIFLHAVLGDTPHTRDTHKDREALGMKRRAYSHSAVRDILKSQTVFRLVNHEFESRLKPMRQSELRDLLVEKVTPKFLRMSDDRLILLARWLGRFGENSHLSPFKTGEPATLAPGQFLASEREFND